MRQLKHPPLQVSDHAVFRWLQRTGVVDVEQLRADLSRALDRSYQAAASIGGGELLILAGGLVYIVRDGTVITVVEEDGRHRHARYLADKSSEPV